MQASYRRTGLVAVTGMRAAVGRLRFPRGCIKARYINWDIVIVDKRRLKRARRRARKCGY